MLLDDPAQGRAHPVTMLRTENADAILHIAEVVVALGSRPPPLGWAVRRGFRQRGRDPPRAHEPWAYRFTFDNA